jgi:hypothetical protein
MGVEPMNTGFADQRVSHFATGALIRYTTKSRGGMFNNIRSFSFHLGSNYFGCATVRRYGFTVL